MTDSRKQMMLDLVVEPAEQPCDDMVSAAEVDGALNLMLSPGAITVYDWDFEGLRGGGCTPGILIE